MAGRRRPSLAGQDREADGSSTGVSGQTQTLIFELGVLYVSALSRPVFANTTLVRLITDRMASTEVGAQAAYADGNVAGQSRINGGDWAMGYAITRG